MLGKPHSVDLWGLNMPIGIDISHAALRIYTQGKSHKHYGIIGIAPQWNEPIVWNNSRAVRSSQQSVGLSFSDIFNQFRADHRANHEYPDITNGEKIEIATTELIADALVQHIPRYSEGFSIFCVDNTLSEFHQTELLKSLGQKGFGQRELLWRPIALCLDHLTAAESSGYEKGDKILVVDFDSAIPEITELEMREHRGQLIPLRSLPENLWDQDEAKAQSFSTSAVLNALISDISGNNQGIEDQLYQGPFARDFMSFLDQHEPTELWIRKGLDHEKMMLQTSTLNTLRNISIAQINFGDITAAIEKILKERHVKSVLWNGLIPRIHTPIEGIEHYLLSGGAGSRGAEEYGRRRLAGEATYLDTLPGLDILSRDEAAGSHKFYPVIPEGVAEGGEVVRIPKPLKKFSLEKGTQEFTAVLRNIALDECKKLVTQLPEIEYGDSHIPLLLKAETRPGQGHALVTIEGREENKDIFGRQGVIALDWQSMEDFEFSSYSGPEVYPVRGRVADDPASLAIARSFATGDHYIGSQFDYPCGRVGYMRIHEPWGYKNPCGSLLREPTRALFGALEEDDPEIQELAEAIGRHITTTVKGTQNRHKYLNYMFRYAPESFREELREIYRSPNPTLNWNTIYAVGRTFFLRADYEIFLNFLIRKSTNSGYPANYSSDEIAAMYWSFFRCLCYYEDSAYAPRSKVEDVLKTIHNYSLHCSENGWPGGQRANVIKYLLSGILFSLRLRRPHRKFLAIDSELYNMMETTINELLPRIQYPPTMFSEPQSDYLNDFVFRFLAEESTEQDLGALQGLVVSMA